MNNSPPYPPAPWTLRGYAIQNWQLVDTEVARPFIPPELKIASLWPGKTLSGIYLANYGRGSVIEYSELIVVPGLVGYWGKLGFWISHIYQDLRKIPIYGVL